MMALVHDFILLNTADAPYPDYMKYIESGRFDVSIDDDLIWYVIDFLNWIPTVNPAHKPTESLSGLNLYGVTVIDIAGAEQAIKVFMAIASLFACGSGEKIRLTGAFSYQLADSYADEPGVERIVAGSARYTSMQLNRQDVISKFELLAELCRKVRDSEGQHYLLHLGV